VGDVLPFCRVNAGHVVPNGGRKSPAHSAFFSEHPQKCSSIRCSTNRLLQPLLCTPCSRIALTRTLSNTRHLRRKLTLACCSPVCLLRFNGTPPPRTVVQRPSLLRGRLDEGAVPSSNQVRASSGWPHQQQSVQPSSPPTSRLCSVERGGVVTKCF
jgi:hypothetical protein